MLARGPTQSSIPWVRGTLYPGHEADHAPPSSAKVKNVSSWCDT